MAITNKTFDVMYELTSAIKQIDRIADQGGENVLENCFIAVKEINLEQLDDEVKMDIIKNIRDGLIKMYQARQVALNKEIGLGITFKETEKEEYKGIDADNMFGTKIMNDAPASVVFPLNKRFDDLEIKSAERA